MDAEPRIKMVVGLGNPGSKYAGTRHNVGFDVLDYLSKQHRAPVPKVKFEGQLTSLKVAETTLVLLWPLTYMNASGRCVKAAVQFYRIDMQRDLLVICDDLSLPIGKLRLRAKGSAGGQKGLADILRVSGTQEIARLRVGIDPAPPEWDAADYVLGRFRPDEKPVIADSIQRAAHALVDWCQYDLSYCMNRLN